MKNECPKCKSIKTVEYGRHMGYQLYLCYDCRIKFTLEAQALDDRIRKIRKALKLTRYELARYFSIAVITLGRWERGETITPKKALLAQIEYLERQLKQGGKVEVTLSGKRRGPKFLPRKKVTGNKQ